MIPPTQINCTDNEATLTSTPAESEFVDETPGKFVSSFDVDLIPAVTVKRSIRVLRKLSHGGIEAIPKLPLKKEHIQLATKGAILVEENSTVSPLPTTQAETENKRQADDYDSFNSLSRLRFQQMGL